MDDDEFAITDRLQKPAEEAGDELAGENILLDDIAFMATTEFRRLLDPASELSSAIEADLQNGTEGEDDPLLDRD
jgi:hypothetical protein